MNGLSNELSVIAIVFILYVGIMLGWLMAKERIAYVLRKRGYIFLDDEIFKCYDQVKADESKGQVLHVPKH